VKPVQEINMAHFTQLNLQGNSGSKPAPNPGFPSGPGGKTPPSEPPKKQHGTAKVVAIAGSLVAAALVATLTLGTNGCSKSSKPAIASPSSPMASVPQTMPVPASIAPSTMAAKAVSKPVKRASRQRTFSTYKNADYGISFRYPKAYRLMKDDKANLEWAGLGPVEMNFVQAGGATLAAVRLPDGMYPGTDFASAFFTVAVNSKLTAKACEQFAFEDGKHAAAGLSEDDMDQARPVEPTKVKTGAAEYTEAESTGGESMKHADAKYYHVFQNGACYEFALGLETKDAEENVKPVDSNAVFGKLNWMLSTVKIETAGIPAKTAPAVAAVPNATPVAIAPAGTDASSTVATPAPTTTAAAVDGGKN
jgi:hypothetical protein